MLFVRTGNDVKEHFFDISERHFCPDCHATMSEVDQVTENGVCFVWYECPRDDCDGQWLQKTVTKMGVA